MTFPSLSIIALVSLAVVILLVWDLIGPSVEDLGILEGGPTDHRVLSSVS